MTLQKSVPGPGPANSAKVGARPNTFVALDGIRGIAALIVLTRHSAPYWNFSLARSYLAVDVFFLLSGFVIAHSYEEKLKDGRLSVGTFTAIRLIRLYPMYLLSLLLALAVASSQSPTNLWKAFAMMPSSGEFAFPLNGVYWSLFAEVIVNVLYALVRPFLSNRNLTVTVCVLATGLLFLERKFGGMDMGWRGNFTDLFAGLVRASFGIFFGILLYRNRVSIWKRLLVWLSPALSIVVIATLLVSPSIGRLDHAVDAFAVFVVFPVCLMAATQRPTSYGGRAMALLGAASYPVYLLHQSVARLGELLLPNLIDGSAPASGVVLVAVVLLIGLSLERFIDVPVRKALMKACNLSRRPLHR